MNEFELIRDVGFVSKEAVATAEDKHWVSRGDFMRKIRYLGMRFAAIESHLAASVAENVAWRKADEEYESLCRFPDIEEAYDAFVTARNAARAASEETDAEGGLSTSIPSEWVAFMRKQMALAETIERPYRPPATWNDTPDAAGGG